ncbi:MAG: ABC transporter ATP-binding protein [Phycisphaeraceae bacterium]|nr:ABC transporter ATP-binding protein [Phycisphaeraceae bacterium]
MPILEARSLSRTYRLGKVDVPVLRDLSLSVAEGEWLAILGASGSGKSTLLHLLGGLDRPDRNRSNPQAGVYFDGAPLAGKSRRDLDRHRARDFGFVFQFYHLLPELTALQNVTVASMVRLGLGYAGRSREVRKVAEELLDRFGLSGRLGHRPAELSGGERQRVAIARALVNEPRVLLADEPTGNLDRATGQGILDTISDLHRDKRQTIVMVTHDPYVADRADRALRLVDGVLADNREESAPMTPVLQG